MKLTVEHQETPSGLVLVVGGEVDMESSPELRDAIKKAIKKKPQALKLDLSNVGYIDSSGIAVLIQGMKWCREKKIQFALLRPSENVRGVLKLSKLLPVFTIEED